MKYNKEKIIEYEYSVELDNDEKIIYAVHQKNLKFGIDEYEFYCVYKDELGFINNSNGAGIYLNIENFPNNLEENQFLSREEACEYLDNLDKSVILELKEAELKQLMDSVNELKEEIKLLK
jgi:hypothetical protein